MGRFEKFVGDKERNWKQLPGIILFVLALVFLVILCGGYWGMRTEL